MKSIQQHITERLQLNKDRVHRYEYFPETREELQRIIKERIKKEGPKCNLNNIDVSKITDMYGLFFLTDFNGDISRWDVSNVENMHEMFCGSSFKGNIDNWKTPNVKDTYNMFMGSPLVRKKPKWYKLVP